jgi:hypothetical protein
MLNTCLLTTQCRILEVQITRDGLGQYLLQMQTLRIDFFEEGYRDDTLRTIPLLLWKHNRGEISLS